MFIKTKDTGAKFIECSECGCGIFAKDYAHALGYNGFRYCPYCGAATGIEDGEDFKKWCLEEDDD